MTIISRVKGLDWESIHTNLDENGFALLEPFLTKEECEDFINMYEDEQAYRTTIDMKRYRFGKGQYKYFDYPLPKIIQGLRSSFYPELAQAANRWGDYLRKGNSTKYPTYPEKHEDFIQMCEASDRIRPTPLILKYGEGDFNALHQDLYGEIYFPFQVVFMLNEKDRDFTGGEFMLVEQVPRAQSRGHIVMPRQGGAAIFPTNHRPAEGKKGYYKNTMRHGVSTVTSGNRYGLGVIFHDSK